MIAEEKSEVCLECVKGDMEEQGLGVDDANNRILYGNIKKEKI